MSGKSMPFALFFYIWSLFRYCKPDRKIIFNYVLLVEKNKSEPIIYVLLYLSYRILRDKQRFTSPAKMVTNR